MAGEYYLVWVDGDGVAEELRLTAGSMVLGRASACDVVLTDSGISREHARIELVGETVTIHDLKSRNGTWVNGERASGVTLLPGDEIGVGRLTLALMEF
ncbi:MAG TPA: FHA domain-containing protein [Dehalococcoidia bacterium]|nr:FHA domain-containing protein [Dehalococcoidia bacterium]